MWLSKRAFLLSSLAALAACGFTPAYGPRGAAGKLQNSIEVNAPTDRNAYLLVQALEDRLGRPGTPRYRLETDFSVDRERMAVTADNVATRQNLIGRVVYRLRDADGTLLTQGRVDALGAYSSTDSTIATSAARDDAYARLARMLADRIVTRLIAAASDLP